MSLIFKTGRNLNQELFNRGFFGQPEVYPVAISQMPRGFSMIHTEECVVHRSIFSLKLARNEQNVKIIG